uniref:CSON006951 protein n=1 Tax=Culicoides sonorensis TaxID=179676 RepID=A0A336MZF9_CULSO
MEKLNKCILSEQNSRFSTTTNNKNNNNNQNLTFLVILIEKEKKYNIEYFSLNFMIRQIKAIQNDSKQYTISYSIAAPVVSKTTQAQHTLKFNE